MSDLSTLAYIHEQVSYPSDYKTEFGYTVHPREGRFYLTFDAILQSFGVMNRNKRKYRATNIMERINNDEYIQTMLRQNTWMGELDHPMPTITGQDLTVGRISNPDPKVTSHFIRSPRLNGNLLEAHIQTDSSNEHGMNFAIKIVDGKIVPAFSARVLGELKNVDGQPEVNVRKLICYDAVLYPSHAEALGKINQPIQESVSEVEKHTGERIIPFKELAKSVANDSRETAWLIESFGLSEDDLVGITSTGDKVVLKENKNIYVQPIRDKYIRTKTRKIMSDWFHS